ncbi:MAG: transposase [Alphaproteobacteria bacterium]|nr:transposase [Alphaproteobacteria bacterium]
MIKVAYTARELAEMTLSGWPNTRQGIEYLAKKGRWPSKPREARGGGSEYPLATLPAALQKAIIGRMVEASKCVNLLAPIEGLSAAIPHVGRIERQAAKLMIVQYFEKYCRTTGQCITRAEQLFLANYKLQAAQTPNDLPFNVYADFSLASLHRWRAIAVTAPEALGGKYGGRKGTGVLKRANGGQVATYIAALMSENRHYKGGHLRDMTRARFGNQLDVAGKKVALPSLRAFERHIVEWKTENAQLFTAITAPGTFKNQMRVAAGDATGSIERLNQQWQIDASPADALCKDGRYSIYAIIDVWSRRALFSVSKTAKTEGSLLLVRKAVMAWGFPESIKTDNGADFISRRFKIALAALGIQQEISPPYSPEKKAFVERVIGTMQRDLMAILPGFSGHNVADRQRIRDQKDFASRLGESADSMFSVELTSTELQVMLDKWADGKYGRAVHEGIGTSPMEKAASWPEAVRKPNDIRALDLLLAPIAGGNGMRSVTKSGLRIDGRQYLSEALLPYIGKQVMVRHDPADLGRIYAFSDDEEFLFEAINPETLGINPAAFARQLQAAQAALIGEKKKELNAVRRKLNRKDLADQILSMHSAGTVEAFPRPAEGYTSPALEAAARAMTATPIVPDSPELKIRMKHVAARMKNAPVEEDLDAAKHQRLDECDRLVAEGKPLPPEQIAWLERVDGQAWLQSRRFQRERQAQADALYAKRRAELGLDIPTVPTIPTAPNDKNNNNQPLVGE